MSATTAPVPHPALVQGWTRGRAKRARMFALLLAAVACAAVLAAFQPWYAQSTAGAASCTRPDFISAITVLTPQSNTAVRDVYANGCLSGRDLAQEDAPFHPSNPIVAQAQAELDRRITTKAPPAMAGLPRPVALVVLFAAVGSVGLVLRNGWFGLVGIVGFYYAHKDLGALETLMLSGDGGARNLPLPGLQLFGWSLLIGWGLLVSATLLVAKHNSEHRQTLKEAALAAGLPAPLGPLDKFLVAMGGKAGLMVDAAVERRRERHPAPAMD